MKIKFTRSRDEEASVFIVSICMTALFALILGSYLTMVEGQADSVARSQSYNAAIPVAEAGVEEALALLNKNYPNVALAGSWSNNLTADNWSSLSSSNTTTKSNLVASGSYYQVTISNQSAGSPVIISGGVVPYYQVAWGAQMTSTRTSTGSQVALIRTVQVNTSTQPIFGGALEAKGNITFHGGATIDSFNSANTNYSVNGQYSAAKDNDKATVATDAAVISAISGTGTVNVYGSVNTGPGGTVGTAGNTSIGSMSWVNGGTNGIQPSRSNDNFNVTFQDITAPTATFIQTPTSGTLGGTNYTMIFQGNQYWGSSNVMYETSVSMTSHQIAIVTNGAVTLYVQNGNSFSVGGQAVIYVAPGSSLTIYIGASSASLGGGGVIGATNAANLSIYGLPTLTSLSYAGSANFVGTIYAPEADFSGAGGSTFIGALMANTFDFVGGATLHYDENLAKIGPSSGYVATSWQEVATPPAYQNLVP